MTARRIRARDLMAEQELIEVRIKSIYVVLQIPACIASVSNAANIQENHVRLRRTD